MPASRGESTKEMQMKTPGIAGRLLQDVLDLYSQSPTFSLPPLPKPPWTSCGW